MNFTWRSNQHEIIVAARLFIYEVKTFISYFFIRYILTFKNNGEKKKNKGYLLLHM